jgi:hypothetical protein
MGQRNEGSSGQEDDGLSAMVSWPLEYTNVYFSRVEPVAAATQRMLPDWLARRMKNFHETFGLNQHPDNEMKSGRSRAG